MLGTNDWILIEFCSCLTILLFKLRINALLRFCGSTTKSLIYAQTFVKLSFPIRQLRLNLSQIFWLLASNFAVQKLDTAISLQFLLTHAVGGNLLAFAQKLLVTLGMILSHACIKVTSRSIIYSNDSCYFSQEKITIGSLIKNEIALLKWNWRNYNSCLKH